MAAQTKIKDYYQILGIPPSASSDEIRAAYKKGARTIHPDLVPQDQPEAYNQATINFQDFVEAYEVLSDQQKASNPFKTRAEYDKEYNQLQAPSKTTAEPIASYPQGTPAKIQSSFPQLPPARPKPETATQVEPHTPEITTGSQETTTQKSIPPTVPPRDITSPTPTPSRATQFAKWQANRLKAQQAVEKPSIPVTGNRITRAIDRVVQPVQNLATKILAPIDSLLAKVMTPIGNMLGGVTTAASKLPGAGIVKTIASKAGQLLSKIMTAISGAFKAVGAAVNAIPVVGQLLSAAILVLPFLARNTEDLVGGVVVALPQLASMLVTAFIVLVMSAVSLMVIPIILSLIIVPLFLIFTILITQWSAYMIPPGDPLPIVAGPGGGGDGGGDVYYGEIPGDPATGCVPLVLEGRTIANSLSPGFWNYWNHSSLYPQFFNSAKYISDPFPCSDVGCATRPDGDDLFWCTYLVRYSYLRAGLEFPSAGWGMADAMERMFRSWGRFVPGSRPVADITPGSVVFMTDGTRSSSHVAILDSKSGSCATIVQSNAWKQSECLTILPDGTMDSGWAAAITGYGLPPESCYQ